MKPSLLSDKSNISGKKIMLASANLPKTNSRGEKSLLVKIFPPTTETPHDMVDIIGSAYTYRGTVNKSYHIT